MKKVSCLLLLLLSIASIGSARIYTSDMQSGNLTSTETVSDIQDGADPISLSEESIIDENKVWMFATETVGIVRSVFSRFKGTTEINGLTYHNLYHVNREYRPSTSVMTKEEYDEAIEYINTIPEFDFDNLTPCYYMRQDGEKYYTLWGNDYYTPDGDLGSMNSHFGDQYGSNIIETLVYDFSVDA